MDELNNIWNADDELNEEQLLKYINGKFSGEEANAFEKKMAASAFINDGVEGLQQFSSAEKISVYAQQVNENLRRKLINKKRKSKHSLKGLSWELITLIAVLLLCLLGYAIVELIRK